MDELIKIKKIIPLIFPLLMFFFVLAIVLLVSVASSGDASIMAGTLFRKPFNDNVNYSITSYFGNRLDPFDNSKNESHSGIDLGAPSGTDVLAIGDGIVYEVGYSESSLGNYVYIKHDYGDIIYFSIYGHMLDNSIVVEKDMPVKAGEKIGCVGSTGRSTGSHLHLTLTSPILSFKKEYLVDPFYVIEGL